MPELPPVPTGESAEEILAELEKSEAWTRGEDYGGPRFTHHLENGQWIQRDENGIEINKTREKEEKGEADLREHLKIIEDLTSKRFSVVRKESSQINSGAEVANQQYENNVHATIYILKNGEIEIHDFQGKKEDLDKLLREYDDSIDDDDYTPAQTATSKPAQTTFNLTSIFSSEEKAPVNAKAEANAWDNFWRDLLKSTSTDQPAQEQSNGSLEIFGFNSSLDNHVTQTDIVEPANKVDHTNSFGIGIDSPALTATQRAESFITIIENQPALVSELATASAQTGKFEAKPLLSASDKTQAETITLYIEDYAEADHEMEQADETPSIHTLEPGVETGFIAEIQEPEPLALIDVPALEPVIIPIMETKDETKDRKQDAAMAIVDFEPVPSNTAAPIAEIQPHTVIAGSESDDLSDEALAESEAIFSYRRHSEGVQPTEEPQTKRVTPGSSDVFKVQDYTKEVKIASTYPRTEIRGSADKSAALAMTESIQDESQKSEDIKELLVQVERDELDSDPIFSKDQIPALDHSPAAIPEFSLLRAFSGENIRDPEPRIRIDSGVTAETHPNILPTIKSQEANKNEVVAIRAQARVLIEQIKAIGRVIKTLEAPAKAIIQEKDLSKVPELSRPLAQPIQELRQPQVKALEKDQTSVILTALERLQTPKQTLGISSENLNKSKPRVAEFTSRARSTTDYKRTTIRSPKVRLINSSENSRQTKFNQVAAVSQSYLDEVELTADNSSGIRLAA